MTHRGNKEITTLITPVSYHKLEKKVTALKKKIGLVQKISG